MSLQRCGLCILVLIAGLFSSADVAYAACTSPAAAIGSLDFQSGSFKYCDGTNWQPLGGSTTDASLLTSGTLADARLSTNVPLKNTSNTFTDTNIFNVPTTTKEAIILKTSDDNTTKHIFETQSSTGVVKTSIASDGVPSATTDLTTKSYVDTSVGNYVLKAGDTMTGALVNTTNSASTALKVTQSGAGHAASFTGGNVGIGTTDPQAQFHLSDSAAKTATYYTAKIDANGTSSTNSIAKTGLTVQSTGAWTGSVGQVNGITSAVSGGTQISSGISSTVTGSGLLAQGGSFTVNNSGALSSSATALATSATLGTAGAVGQMYGLNTSVSTSAASVTTAYGINIGGIIKSGSGSITNGYAIGIAASNQATNPFAIYSLSSAPSYYAGKIGIGTSTPTSALNVSGTLKIGDGGELCTAVGAGGLKWSGTAMQFCDGTAWANIDATGGGDILNGGNTTGGEISIGTNDTQKLNFRTNGAKAMTIATNGFVGIGTTSPGYRFVVDTSGSSNVAGVFAYDWPNSNGWVNGLQVQSSNSGTDGARFELYHQRSGGGAPLQSGDLVGDILFRGTDSAWASTEYGKIRTLATNVTSGSSMGQMIFSTLKNGAGTDQMAILGSGNVGIGTTNPTSSLVVKQTAAMPDSGNGNGYVLQVHSIDDSPYLAGFYNDTYSTTAPVLEYFGGGTTYGPYVPGDFMMGTPTAKKIMFYTNGYLNPRLTVDGSGNVGIGTNSPTNKLVVAAGSTYGGGISVSATNSPSVNVSDGNFGGYFGIKTNAGDYSNAAAAGDFIVGAFNAGGSGSLVLTEQNGVGSIKFATGTYSNNDTVKMTILNGGNVGIGTTNPGQKLEVNGNILATSYLYSSDERLKTNIEPLDHSLEKILSLTTVNFDWKAPLSPEADRRQIGLIAQNVQQVYPEAVTEGKDGFLRVNYPALISPVIDAIRDLYRYVTQVDSKVTTLETKVQTLEQKNKELEERLTRIEQQLERSAEGK